MGLFAFLVCFHIIVLRLKHLNYYNYYNFLYFPAAYKQFRQVKVLSLI